MKSNRSLFERRKSRNRTSLKKKLNGKIRLSVFRSNKHIYCQIIDDQNNTTLLSSSTLDRELRKKIKSTGTKVEKSKEVGKKIAELAMSSGFKKCCFDRNGYLYHGRVKSLAEGAREAGLKF